jgi:hypothetical protein
MIVRMRVRRTRQALPSAWAIAVIGLVVWGANLACSRPNPLYRGQDAAAAVGAAGSSGSAGGAGTSAAGDGAAGTAGTSGDSDGGPDTSPPACAEPTDCMAARGAPPCGAWECRSGQCAVACPNCVDRDGDGFGVGAGCAGPDCDDGDPALGSSGTRACYEGAPATTGVGECRAGVDLCVGGVWQNACTKQVLPSGEACNGLDDDCNGQVDDGLGMITCGVGACARTVPACANGATGVCKAGTPALAETCGDGKDNDCNGLVDEGCDGFCVRVAPNGDDQGTGTANRPFRTIQAAIDFAAGAPNRPKNVCVAGGDMCGSLGTYNASEANPLTMANGISVYGNYEATTWSRCSFGTNGLPNLNVIIAPRTGTGIVFPATVTTPTTLDGVHVVRANSGGGPGGAGTIAGITVSGAKQVQISNVVIDDAQSGMTTYGVNLVNGAEALITRSAIFGGAGTSAAIGVHSVGSKPTIRDNCASIDPTTGRCVAACGPMSLGIHGRSQTGGGPDNGTAEAVAIDLSASPGALVERNAICGTTSAMAAGVRIAGAAEGTVIRGNGITADGGSTQALGISLQACADAAPWIVDNASIVGEASGATARAAGINAIGACHPVIDGNAKITTGTNGVPGSAFGVFCGADGLGGSRCAIHGNALVQGSTVGRTAQTFAVSCDAACGRISRNTLVGGSGAAVIGLSLRAARSVVDRNTITGGCGTKTTTSVLADSAGARLENNVLRGAACEALASTPETYGVRVLVARGASELELGSNTIDAAGSGQCQATAVSLGLSAGPAGATLGVFRNNILRVGPCVQGRVDFLESNADTTPRLFEHNDLDPNAAPAGPVTLYQRPGASPPPSLAAINAFPGSSGNISAAPGFVGAGDYHLGAGSPCVNAGTPVGAPKLDFDGKPRDDHPDIGAFER